MYSSCCENSKLTVKLIKLLVSFMERNEWIAERLRVCEERMDTLFSEHYDEGWGEMEKPHQEMVEKLVTLLPVNPYILDAACGTGKYFRILIKNNCKILGIDNSSGMLSQARNKYPEVSVQKGTLQDISFNDTFDAIICMDAMENVFPEHWPLVLRNFYNSIKNQGYIYFTVEIIPEEELKENYEASIKEQLPVKFGEFLENGGYHYYPELSQVRDWIKESKLQIIEEQEQGVYHHFLAKKKQ